MAHRNVQRLSERNGVEVQADTQAFSRGFVEGQTGLRDGYPVYRIGHPISEQDIFSIIRNLVEIDREGWLREELIRHDAGVIAGWLLRQEG